MGSGPPPATPDPAGRFARARTLFDTEAISACGYAVAVLDPDGRYMQVNHDFAALQGLSEDELAGRPEADVCAREIAVQLHRNDVSALTSAEPLIAEEIVFDRVGRRRVSTCRFALYDQDGAAAAVCRISAPPSARLRMLSEARRLLRAMRPPGTPLPPLDGSDAPAGEAERASEVELAHERAAPKRSREALAAERDARTDAEQQLASVRDALEEAERALAAARASEETDGADVAGVRAESEATLIAERQAREQAEARAAAESAALDDTREALEAERGALEQVRSALEDAERALAAARASSEVEGAVAADARAESEAELIAERRARDQAEAQAEAARAVLEETREELRGERVLVEEVRGELEQEQRSAERERAAREQADQALASARHTLEQLEQGLASEQQARERAERAELLQRTGRERAEHALSAERAAREQTAAAVERERQQRAELAGRIDNEQQARDELERRGHELALEREARGQAVAVAASERDARVALEQRLEELAGELERARGEHGTMEAELTDLRAELEAGRQSDESLTAPDGGHSPALSAECAVEILASVGAALNSADSMRAGLTAALEVLGVGLDWDAVVAWGLDSDGRRLSCQRLWLRPGADLEAFEGSTWRTVLPVDVPPAGDLTSAKPPSWKSDIDPASPSARERSIVAAGLSTCALVPVVHRGVLLGAIEALARAGREREPTTMHVLTGAAHQVALLERLEQLVARPRWRV